jgi:CRISPR-associated endonuclease/helicase Cas3
MTNWHSSGFEPPLFGFWGKTSAAGEEQRFGYKPVIHHLLDVAAVALRLIELCPDRLAREAVALGLPAARLAHFFAFLVGLHDLGKFSAAFQAKRPDLWIESVLGPYVCLSDPGHWRLTAIMLCSTDIAAELEGLLPNANPDRRAPLIAAIAGHHGRPTDATEHNARADEAASNRSIGGVGLAAALAATRELRRLIEPEALPELDELETCKALSWSLAGLTSVADWIGSDAEIFQFEAPDMPLHAYWQLALNRADAAIAHKGLGPKPPTRTPSFAAIAGQSAPRPMQVAAESMPLPDGPALVVIEDTTGSGKTEAALVLAARMMAAGKAEGLYFALPTMATANAMYARLGDIHHRLFAEGARPNLVLAHAQAKWNEEFLGSIGDDAETPANSDGDVAAFCTAWLADSRRKAFFADVGAGTIDQAFLAVLRKKWLALRQYGLASKVLLVDEAHAFDAYMSRELQVLLHSHAAAGGSAIVLSATLATAQRQQLVDAFRRGLGQRRKATVANRCYPLVTTVGGAGVTETEVPFAEALRREVAVKRVPDSQTAQVLALAAARRGAAVLLLRNAVDEAIASYEALRAEHPQTQLFHARFAIADRQRIETDVLARFGHDAGQEERAGHILIATQVVEQSLDLDFDCVITDLAPVDLLIQRAGRLWRHMDVRPAAERPVEGPLLHVISPEPREDVDAGWLGPALGKGAGIYDHPGVMWRTANVLFAAGAIRTPESFRPMIEAVYAEDGDVPAALAERQGRAEGADHGARSLANRNLIDVEDGYAMIGELSADEEVGTRLGEPTITVRLARIAGERLVPWAYNPGANAPPGMRDWALSEVRVRTKWLGEVHPPPSQARLIDLTKRDWLEWDRNVPVLVVGSDGVIANGSSGSAFAYSGSTGLARIPSGKVRNST